MGVESWILAPLAVIPREFPFKSDQEGSFPNTRAKIAVSGWSFFSDSETFRLHFQTHRADGVCGDLPLIVDHVNCGRLLEEPRSRPTFGSLTRIDRIWEPVVCYCWLPRGSRLAGTIPLLFGLNSYNSGSFHSLSLYGFFLLVLKGSISLDILVVPIIYSQWTSADGGIGHVRILEHRGSMKVLKWESCLSAVGRVRKQKETKDLVTL